MRHKMNVNSFHTCLIKIDTFYLFNDMHLYFLKDHDEDSNTCTFINCTAIKLNGKIEDIKIIQEVMEEELSSQVKAVLPIDNVQHRLLWYTTVLHIKKNLSLKPLQVWVSEPDGELFVVHPDQSGVSRNKIRILASSAHITKPHFLLYESK